MFTDERATAGEETLFRGLHKLMPGHVLTMDGHSSISRTSRA